MKKSKGTDYFEYFQKSAEYALKAAELMDELLKSYDRENFREKVDQVHKLEHEADACRHSMVEQLVKEFLPPIEREDIVALAQQLDTVVDSIDDVLLRVYMFDVESIREETFKFTELIIRCCTTLRDAVKEFRNFKKSSSLKNLLITVNTLESEGDALHSESVRTLFLNNTSPIETIIWMKIYDDFEDCLDACEDAVDIIEGVIMKNS